MLGRGTKATALALAAAGMAMAGGGVAQADVKGTCAAVLEPATGTVLLDKAPFTRCAMGSTAKVMTIHLAVKAVRDGRLGLGERMRVTPQAAVQGCTCLGQSRVPMPSGDVAPQTYHRVGDDIGSVADALRGTIFSAGQSTLALAETVAARTLGLPEATTTAESLDLQRRFVQMMNTEAAALGLTSLVFGNAHGGDESVPGAPQAPRASALGMTRLVAIARQDALFQEVFDTRAWEFTGWRRTTLGLTPHLYRLGRGFAYAAGATGDKDGGSPLCTTCRLTHATRLGRSLVADVMQSPDAAQDVRDALHSAFSDLLRPDAGPSLATPIEAVRHDLACSGTTCLTAAVQPDGRLALDTFSSGSSVVRLASHVAQVSPSGPLVDVSVAALGGGRWLVATADSTGRSFAQTWSSLSGISLQASTSRNEGAQRVVAAARVVSTRYAGASGWLARNRADGTVAVEHVAVTDGGSTLTTTLAGAGQPLSPARSFDLAPDGEGALLAHAATDGLRVQHFELGGSVHPARRISVSSDVQDVVVAQWTALDRARSGGATHLVGARESGRLLYGAVQMDAGRQPFGVVGGFGAPAGIWHGHALVPVLGDGHVSVRMDTGRLTATTHDYVAEADIDAPAGSTDDPERQFTLGSADGGSGGVEPQAAATGSRSFVTSVLRGGRVALTSWTVG